MKTQSVYNKIHTEMIEPLYYFQVLLITFHLLREGQELRHNLQYQYILLHHSHGMPTKLSELELVLLRLLLR